MDETFTQGPDDSESGAPTGPMPLSMPPMNPVHPVNPVNNPVGTIGEDADSGLVTPPLGSPRAESGPMPLSMPPYVPPTADAGGPGSPPPPGSTPPYGSQWFGEIPPPPSEPPRRRRGIAVAAAIALLVGGLGAGLGASFGSSSNQPTSSLEVIPTTPTPPLTGSADVESRVYAAVEPAVVDINTDVASPAGEQSEAAGTGMIVTSSGEVLTNNHVIDEATSILVTIQHRSGPVNGQYRAKVIGLDSVHDVALLQIEGVSNLPHVSIGNSSAVTVGQTVYAIGNALGFGGAPSVQAGAITATSRTISAADELDASGAETLHNLLQTNAQIQSGDSGGPLVNVDGQVVGMDTAASSTDGNSTAVVGFAIPIDQARTIANNIAAGKTGNGVTIGYSPFLGVQLAPPGTSSNAGDNFNFGNGFSFNVSGGNSGEGSPTENVQGVAIEGVVSGSPAAGAGLESGDIITSVNGSKVTQSSQVKTALANLKPGDSVAVTYVDVDGDTHTISLKLAAIPY